MRIGILEIMDTGHIVLAETLCKIFCSDSQNQVSLFTLKIHADNLKYLIEKYPNLSIIANVSQQTRSGFLKEIGSLSFDRLYIVTLNKLFAEFSRWRVKSRVFLVVHNLDEWFDNSLFQSFRKFFYTIFDNQGFKLLIYHFKLHFIYPTYKKHILKIINRTNGHIVVLSESVHKEVKKLNIKTPVEVIPFSVFDPSLVLNDNGADKPLRICVPGILSQYRRNYLALLDLLEKQLEAYKYHFEIDFLGGVQPENLLNDSGPILEKIKILNDTGFTIIIHNVPFIPPEEYDRELAHADIILGNMNVILNKHSEYGRTKETGLPFAMIKAARPGILPDNYPFPKEISSSIFLYHDFEDLGSLLIQLIKDPHILNTMKKEARANSEKFTPEIIYKQLFMDHN